VRFLVDECLHPSLVFVAQSHGYEAHHVNFLGLASSSDRVLMHHIIDADFVFVTNNAGDFRRLYREQPLHAGLVLIIPQFPPPRQGDIFDLALKRIGDHDDLTNEILEVLLENGEVNFKRYPWPAP